MADQTHIEWCDSTFNPWEGCQKVGPGCDHCYAETRNARFGTPKGEPPVAKNWGPGAPRRRTSPANWRKPLQWQADAARFLAEHGRRQRVFCASLADVFDNAADPADRADLFALIRRCPDLDWLLLTKRIGNAAAMAEAAGGWPSNVWLGATIVNQAEADRDVIKLRQTKYDAGLKVAFLSVEPMLGPIDISDHLWPAHGWWKGPHGSYAEATAAGAECGMKPQALLSAEVARSLVDWIIVGGESGDGARPMHPDWARSLRDQCAAADVPFLFKQWGEWAPGENSPNTVYQREVHTADWFDGRWLFETMHGNVERHADDEPTLFRAGKKAAGRRLDGVQHDGAPA